MSAFSGTRAEWQTHVPSDHWDLAVSHCRGAFWVLHRPFCPSIHGSTHEKTKKSIGDP